MLFDTTDASRPVMAAQRRLQAEHIKRLKAKHGSAGAENTGVCFAITNKLVRGMLTAITWLNPFQKETITVVATREEADRWCRRWISGLGVKELPGVFPPE